MDIFKLQQDIIGDYSDYIESFLSIRDKAIARFVQNKIITQRSLWPEGLLQLNPAYEKAATVQDLVERDVLHPESANIFRNRDNKPFQLYRHQEDAIIASQRKEPFIVTSGTGSGKTMTYFMPIFDAILRANPAENKVHAIVVYPMNALVNSQETALNTLADRYRKAFNRDMPVRFGRYTGQESDTDKEKLRKHPPHILLTNYVMLELMLVRPRESEFVGKRASSLQFLVLDELHTYRGRQGADVALLIRRLRENCGNANLLTIGTSATMATGNTRLERRTAVAEFASKLFGTSVKPDSVIEETLRPTMQQQATDAHALRQAVTGPLPAKSWEAFTRHPLSAWIEKTFGIRAEEGNLRRQIPITLSKGAARLAEETGLGIAVCADRLRAMLLLGTVVLSPDGDPAFAFKLHQFISQGSSIYATFEDSQKRLLTMEGQYFAPGESERLLYPLVFCRVCGQEYYTVRWSEKDRFLYPDSAQMGDLLDDDDFEASHSGYVMLDPNHRFRDEIESLPEHWLTSAGRVKKEYRRHQPERIHIQPDGQIVVQQQKGTLPGWFQPEPFMLCLNCGEAYTLRDKKDFRKLARLSSEGRSTSTTLLSLTAVSAMHHTSLAAEAQKILSFTDNRQDASLQAGHFNDFVQVALIRTALYRSLLERPFLEFEYVTRFVIEGMGVALNDYARQKDLDSTSKQAQETRAAFHDVVEYRLYEDLRRGWRLVQPNLEQSGLLHVTYRGLPELALRETVWSDVPFMDRLESSQRAHVLETILDEMRRQLAIDVDCLKPDHQDELRRRAAEYLKGSWAFDQEERLRYAGLFVLPGEPRAAGDFSLSTRSVIGRWLRSMIKQSTGMEPDADYYDKVIQGIRTGLLKHGILIEQEEGWGSQHRTGVRLRPSALLWQKGTGKPTQSPLRRYRAVGGHYEVVEQEANRYFRDFYSNPQTLHGLQKMDAAEHTAQISVAERIERENRFRQGNLSTLFCSPTMELGIDIADLNAVHMRNIPPTPANYAQRSGRSGRAGQPALVLAYCSVGSAHDQYYFRNRTQMVAGSVVPPRIELNNADLIQTHMHAIWLAKTGLQMRGSILEIVDVSSENYALFPEIQTQIRLDHKGKQACLDACRSVLVACNLDEAQADWLHTEWLDNLIENAPYAFDRAFDRWRDEFRLAWAQLIEAQNQKQRALLRRGREAREEASQATRLEFEAQRRLDLLRCENIRPEESDFYPYRYLASEGFLPGYNFPALPVRAYLARSSKDGEFVSRPRFLAVNEFGPNNIIYHNGTKYQVNQAMLPIQEPEKRFVRAKLCQNCGYLHEGESAHLELCEQCGNFIDVDNGRYLESLLEMPTAGTVRRERITCDEEERSRRGFVIDTFFRFARVQNRPRRRLAAAVDRSGDALLHITYAPSAELWRINQRWKRQVEDIGYRLDMRTGQWLNRNEALSTNGAGSHELKSNVRLFVRDNANAVLLRVPLDLNANEAFLASLQYALVTAVQETFQVEESELASERLGKDEHRTILIWEASEGSLGVLRQLAEDESAIARVAAKALELLHFDAKGTDLRPGESEADGCVHACYDCLLSYYNQMDHWRLNRHLIRDYLLALAASNTQTGSDERPYDEHYASLRARTDPDSDLERHFLDYLVQTRRRLPDSAQMELADAFSEPDFFYAPNVCVFCDGTVHDEPQQKAQDDRVRQELKNLGYRVIVYRYDADLENLCRQYPDVFGSHED